jgi:hypothetical protein
VFSNNLSWLRGDATLHVLKVVSIFFDMMIIFPDYVAFRAFNPDIYHNTAHLVLDICGFRLINPASTGQNRTQTLRPCITLKMTAIKAITSNT